MPGFPTFSRLFEEHRGPVVRYVRRRLGDDAGEDAAVEVFRQAERARPNDHARYGSVRPWVYALTTQVISERWRTERHRLESLERHAHQPPARHPALDLTRPLDPHVANGLRCLPAADRETVLLVVWGELTFDATAASLGVTVSVVHDRLATVHAHIVDGLPADGRSGERTPAPTLAELLAALSDNADLGLDPVRQPRIESAVSRRFAAAPPHWSARAGEPQFLGT